MTISYNPNRVPSVSVDGSRAPICVDCVEALNEIRAGNGLGPLVPMSGAYEPSDDGDPTLFD